MKFYAILKAAAWLSIGTVLGGLLFSKSLPRSFIAIGQCDSNCYRPSDLAGLMTSTGIQLLPGIIPGVVAETDKCLVMKHPKPEARIHLLLFPKHDAKSIGSLTSEDQTFVMGCFALVAQLASKNRAQNYRLITNGPALQHVTYLHFHFLAN